MLTSDDLQQGSTFRAAFGGFASGSLYFLQIVRFHFTFVFNFFLIQQTCLEHFVMENNLPNPKINNA